MSWTAYVKGNGIMASLGRIKQMVMKEFIQIFRDKRMKAVIFVIPLIQTTIFGYAVTTDVNNIPIAVYDQDGSYESRELVRRLTASGYFSVTHYVTNHGIVERLLDRGQVSAVIGIGRDFSSDIKKGRSASVQILVDGTDSNTATVAVGYINRIVASYASSLMRGIGATTAIVELRPRAWYNPELKSRYYMVPGVIAMVIMVTTLLLTSMAVVREREIGTMEQLMVTPLRPMELILGKTIPFAALAFFEMALITLFGVLVFHIPIRGPLILLPVSTAVYLLSVLGIGLFISTVAKTLQQAMMATFLFFSPAVLLSGFVFPIENMPIVIQYITYVNPLRYFLVVLRGLFLKGNGIDILWPNILALFSIGAAVMTLSSMRFRKRMV